MRTEQHLHTGKILIIDDDNDVATSIQGWLQGRCKLVDVVNSGEDALKVLKEHDYDLMILDLRLPDISGLDVCREYRASGGQARVLMLTGRSCVQELEEGFDAGADDYLIKPFEPRELLARVKALLGRSSNLLSDILLHGDLALDLKKRIVLRRGRVLCLQRLEFSLLEHLMKRPDKTFSQNHLLANVWSSSSNSSIDAVRTLVSNLKKKVNIEGQLPAINTVYGIGYKLQTHE